MKPDPSTDESFCKPSLSRGLNYPFGEDGPEVGGHQLLQDGIRWVRLPVPGSLRHINVWVLDDDDGISIVDTGLYLEPTKDVWTKLIAQQSVKRVVLTHFHPDHLGCAGWLCETYGAKLWMNRTEFLLARSILVDRGEEPPMAAFAQMKSAGWDSAQLASMQARGWGNFARLVSPLPPSIKRLDDGDTIQIGARTWTVVIGRGHSPEHVCLVDFVGKVMFAGDQVLPRISSNVSVSLTEPDGDPLGEWLASIDRLRTLPDDVLVLPAHGNPFYGLHTRLSQLADGHHRSLDQLHAFLAAAPRRAVDCFSTLFRRTIDDRSLGLATGEALAHLHHLEATGRAQRETKEGVSWWSAV